MQIVPPAWRALASLCYLSGFLSIPVVFPFVVWMLYPRSRYLRGHALVAGMIQAIGMALTFLLRVPGLLFLIEENQFFMTPEQFAGALFSTDQLGTLVLLVLLTVAFITFIILPAIAGGQTAVLTRRPRRGALRVTGDDLMLAALAAAVLTPLLFYMQGVWGPMSGGGFAPAGSEGQGDSFFGLHLKYFEDPYRLFPGHVILLWSMTGLVLAVRGRLHFFGSARRLFIRFQREHRATGDARYRAAAWRALILPGWGQFFAGQRLAGLGTLAVFLLASLFWVLSAGFVYGRIVADLPGYNTNFSWNILSDLGMRANAVSDGQLRDLLASWWTFAGLSLGLALVVLYSRYTTRQIFRPGGWKFWPALSNSLLLHLVPVVAILLIPVALLPLIPPSQASQPPAGIPREFERLDEDDVALNGSAGRTGEDGESEGHRNNSERVTPVEVLPLPQSEAFADGPEPALSARDEQRSLKDESLDPEQATASESGEKEFITNADDRAEESPLKGKRKKQTYSNYLSVKIRAPEKDFRYWDRLPQPYSAVFEYKITAAGRVHSVRIVEASDYAAADELTVRLIESMSTVLPPPGEEDVVVTELFWNTGPADPELPTELQQRLSQAFDGRVIERESER